MCVAMHVPLGMYGGQRKSLGVHSLLPPYGIQGSQVIRLGSKCLYWLILVSLNIFVMYVQHVFHDWELNLGSHTCQQALCYCTPYTPYHEF